MVTFPQIFVFFGGDLYYNKLTFINLTFNIPQVS